MEMGREAVSFVPMCSYHVLRVELEAPHSSKERAHCEFLAGKGRMFLCKRYWEAISSATREGHWVRTRQMETATWRENLSSWFGMLTASYSVFMIFSFQKIQPLSKQQTVNHWRSQKGNPQPRALPWFLLCLPQWAIHPWLKSQGLARPA